jgi:hypothetical protein
VSGMTPSRVVSAAPTIAIDLGFIAVTSGPGGRGILCLAEKIRAAAPEMIANERNR